MRTKNKYPQRLMLIYSTIGYLGIGFCFGASPENGFKYLTEKPYTLTGYVSQDEFDSLWKVWPKDKRDLAEKSNLLERRKLAFKRYGFYDAPYENNGAAVGFLQTNPGSKAWTVNCLICHAGKVDGKIYFGAPNNTLDLQTLLEDRLANRLGINVDHLNEENKSSNSLLPGFTDKLAGFFAGSLFDYLIPTNLNRGTSIAWAFTLSFFEYRNLDLNRKIVRNDFGDLQGIDQDAPAWWNVKNKQRLFTDGFLPKDVKSIMHIFMSPENSGKTVRGWKKDYEDILSYIESIQAPKFAGPVDQSLVRKGKLVFANNCAHCHGTYGDNPTYPNRMVSLSTIGTDPERVVHGITVKVRNFFKNSWLGDYGHSDILTDPNGYLAPRLNGVWASAPYFHNGSVPTLWHVLHPEHRPKVWRSLDRERFNEKQVGLSIEAFSTVPDGISRSEGREFYNASLKGKSVAGHPFADELMETEKDAVLEYLKIL